MLRERVNVTDFESAHFASQLVERLGWAVGDADEAERAAEHAEPEPTTHDAHADLAPTTQSETVEPAHAIAR
jgi:hypothetical protein